MPFGDERTNYVISEEAFLVAKESFQFLDYVKESLVDGVADPLEPEALLYIPTKKSLKLVAVE